MIEFTTVRWVKVNGSGEVSSRSDPKLAITWRPPTDMYSGRRIQVYTMRNRELVAWRSSAQAVEEEGR